MYLLVSFCLLGLLPCIICQTPEWPQPIGCFSGDSSLDQYYKEDPDMTVEMCMKNCVGFTYAKVELSTCGCGNSYSDSQPEEARKCNKQCSGGSRINCGGSGVYNVLQIREPPAFEYLGCQSSNNSDSKPDSMKIQNFTLDSCAPICKFFSFDYFGVEAGEHCFCSEKFSVQNLENIECGASVCGDTNEMCGGFRARAFYRISKPEEASIEFVPPTNGRIRANRFRNKNKVIIPDYSVAVKAGSGKVTGFNVTAKNKNLMHFSFWRPTGEDMTFSYVDGYDYKAKKVGEHRIELDDSEAIEVEEGDVLGLYLPKNAAFYHNEDRDGCKDRTNYSYSFKVAYPFKFGDEIKMRPMIICGVPLISDITIA